MQKFDISTLLCLPDCLPDKASPTAWLSLRRSSSISCQQTDLSLLTDWLGHWIGLIFQWYKIRG